jgi:predicted TIM-barrel fold metal-dependent hydrolase
MRSNHLIIIAAVIVLGAWGIKVYAGTLTMNTYYPSPNGYYDTLVVKNKILFPCYDTTTPEYIARTNAGPAYTMYGTGIPANDSHCNGIWPFG